MTKYLTKIILCFFICNIPVANLTKLSFIKFKKVALIGEQTYFKGERCAIQFLSNFAYDGKRKKT